MSSTSSGIGIHRSVLTSCRIRSMGKIGLRSSGPTGCLVPGWSGGLGLFGMSAMMLYHFVGISLSDSTIFVCRIAASCEMKWIVAEKCRYSIPFHGEVQRDFEDGMDQGRDFITETQGHGEKHSMLKPAGNHMLFAVNAFMTIRVDHKS